MQEVLFSTSLSRWGGKDVALGECLEQITFVIWSQVFVSLCVNEKHNQRAQSLGAEWNPLQTYRWSMPLLAALKLRKIDLLLYKLYD